MSSERVTPVISGNSFSNQSLAKIMTAAAHADDYVFQELLKLAPFSVTTDRVILPFAARGQSSAVVQPGLLAVTPLVIMPFRAVLGSRILAATGAPVPVDPIVPTAPELNYRDARSAVFAVASGAPPTLGYAIPAAQFPSNVTAFGRWDLVYAALYIDQASTSAQIIVKPATGGGTTPYSAAPSVLTSVGSPPMALTGTTPAIVVATGVPSASAFIPPVAPTVPADVPASGIYYFPLALVQIPGGFVSGTSTIATKQICITASVGELAEMLGGRSSGPVSAISGAASAILPVLGSSTATWGNGHRPSFVLSKTMRGGASKVLQLDATLAAATPPSLGNGVVLDKDLDWRNRYFRVRARAAVSAGGIDFATDPLAGGAPYLPNAALAMSAIGPATFDQFIVQPLVVTPGNGALPSGSPTAFSDGTSVDIQAAGVPLYLQLTNLINGATLKSVIIYGSTGGFAAAASALNLCKFAPGTGVRTVISAITSPAAVMNVTGCSFPASGSLTEVIDTSQFYYYVEVNPPASGFAIQWSAPVAQLLVPYPPLECDGQSMREDSLWMTGATLGTGSGAGMIFYATPAQWSFMGAASKLGVYVDLATGHLMLLYVGTPGILLVAKIEATGADDNF